MVLSLLSKISRVVVLRVAYSQYFSSTSKSTLLGLLVPFNLSSHLASKDLSLTHNKPTNSPLATRKIKH